MTAGYISITAAALRAPRCHLPGVRRFPGLDLAPGFVLGRVPEEQVSTVAGLEETHLNQFPAELLSLRLRDAEQLAHDVAREEAVVGVVLPQVGQRRSPVPRGGDAGTTELLVSPEAHIE